MKDYSRTESEFNTQLNRYHSEHKKLPISNGRIYSLPAEIVCIFRGKLLSADGALARAAVDALFETRLAERVETLHQNSLLRPLIAHFAVQQTLRERRREEKRRKEMKRNEMK